jgi:hypothetical protein
MTQAFAKRANVSVSAAAAHDRTGRRRLQTVLACSHFELLSQERSIVE